MSPNTKSNLFIWINKYGLPMVAAVFLYVDFVRPIRQEHTAFLAQVVSVMNAQTEIMREVADNQKAVAENQTVLLSTLRKLTNMVAEQRDELRRHKAGVKPEAVDASDREEIRDDDGARQRPADSPECEQGSAAPKDCGPRPILHGGATIGMELRHENKEASV